MNDIEVSRMDFLQSLSKMTAASNRSGCSYASALPERMAPVLQHWYQEALRRLEDLMGSEFVRGRSTGGKEEAILEDVDVHVPSIHRPRLLLCGKGTLGQPVIAAAMLQRLEGFHVQPFDLAKLLMDPSTTPEAACVQYFHEVRRHKPAILYIPDLPDWWTSISESMRATFTQLLHGLPAADPILLLATSQVEWDELPCELQDWFRSFDMDESYLMLQPAEADARRTFFADIFHRATQAPPAHSVPQVREKRELAVLPRPSDTTRLMEREPNRLQLEGLREHNEFVQRELRRALRDVTEELLKQRKYRPFCDPVDPSVEGYYDIVTEPMDLSTVMQRVNHHTYTNVKQYLADVDLIVSNAERFNDEKAMIVNRARSLQDEAYSMISRLEPELIRESNKCEERLSYLAKYPHLLGMLFPLALLQIAVF